MIYQYGASPLGPEHEGWDTLTTRVPGLVYPLVPKYLGFWPLVCGAAAGGRAVFNFSLVEVEGGGAKLARDNLGQRNRRRETPRVGRRSDYGAYRIVI